MRMLLPLALATVLAACSSSPVITPDDHPAASTAGTAAATVEFTTLDPVPQPDLPAPLRPDGHPPAGSMAGLDPSAVEGHDMSMMDHDMMSDDPDASMESDGMEMDGAAMDHTAMMSDDAMMDMAAMSDDLGAALDAYLTIQSALASDELPGASSVRAFDAAVANLGAHGDVATIRAGATSLAAAEDLGAARIAFGELSAPFVSLVETTGVPEGYDVARFTCGMFTDVPEGGVWLQRGAATKNPYYGSAMLTCGAEDRPMPMMDHEGMDHGQMKSGEMDHGNMNHDDRK